MQTIDKAKTIQLTTGHKLILKQFNTQSKEQDEINLNKGINMLTYGVRVIKLQKRGKSSARTYTYILEENPLFLQWLSRHKLYIQSRISLLDIQDIRYNYPYQINTKVFKYPIVLHTSNYDLCFIFDSEEQRALWHMGLQHIICRLLITQEVKRKDQVSIMSEQIFAQGDRDGNGELDLKELKLSLRAQHLNINPKKLNELFQQYTNKEKETISSVELKLIIRKFMEKNEIQQIFQQYASDYQPSDPDSKKVMKVSEFKAFLQNENETYLSEEEIVRVFQDIPEFTKRELNTHFQLGEVEAKQDNKSSQKLIQQQSSQQYSLQAIQEEEKISLFQFTQFLIDNNNSIFEPARKTQYQDMSKPLTDYFCNSSHNTYLLNDQLVGCSSTQAYINAFLKGCRCVEIDIWNGKKGEPITFHGHTMTSKILFDDVIQAINDYAFKFSSYPLILSFENHCSEEQQEKMSQSIAKHFKDKLFQLSVDAENYYKYPVLEGLKNKIIIKGKGTLKKAMDILYPHRDIQQIRKQKVFVLEDYKQGKYTFEDIADMDDSAIIQTIHIPEKPWQMITLQKSGENELELENGSENQDEDLKNFDEEVEGINSLQQQLGLFSSKFHLIDINRNVFQISSFCESKIKALFTKKEEEIIDFHRKFFSRIYPSGLRVGSSNYDPFYGFCSGSQIVAINVQTSDLSNLYNQGIFQENGGVGYVLKPEWMRSDCVVKKYVKDFNQPIKKIKLVIISGQKLRPFNFERTVYDIVDPYVEVSIKGTPKDTAINKSQKTKVIDNNGFNPIWNEPKNQQKCNQMEFEISCPDLALLVFQVRDDEIMKDRQLGWYSLPVNCIRNGFRIVPLWDQQFQQIQFSYLFVYIKVTECTDQIVSQKKSKFF